MDTQTFERLANQYMDTVYRVLLHSCGSVQDAQDLMQEVFLKLWKCREVFAEDENAKRWLIRVAVNESRSFWRKSGKHRNISLDEVASEPSMMQENHIELFEAVQKLPVKYRQVVYLHYFEGYQTREIAQMLDRSESTVRVQLTRARRMLRAELEA